MNKWTRPFELTRASDAAGERRRSSVPHHYFAFLSYSHEDSAEAEWLHQELESFRVPASLAGKLNANGVIPKRLSPIFRDQHELAASHDLSEDITAALEASRCLIVLCSPAAARSKWTNAEIDLFKRIHPEGCIIAAVIAGEPLATDIPGREDEECFPPALVAKYNRRGRPTGKKTEPLAADLREGKGGRRVGFLKVVAGVLGVGLDELVQRETTRRQRRLAILSAVSLGGMAVTTTLAVTAIQARDAAREQRREAEGLIGFMLGDLKDKLDPLGRLDVLDSIGARALAYYQTQDKSSLSDDSLAQRSKALTLLGEIADSRGELDNASRLYREAFASTEELLRRDPQKPERIFDHAQNVFYLGQVAYERGNTAGAAERFNQYKTMADQMVALAPDQKKYRLEQVYANTNLGTVLMDEHRFREAAEAYQALLGEAEALASADPGNMVYQRQLGQDLAWLADALEDSGDLDRALATRERQVRLVSDLQRIDPHNNQLQRDALTAHRAIGRLLASQGDIEGGLAEAMKAAAIGDALLRVEPSNIEWLTAAARNSFDLGAMQSAAGKIEPAAASIRAGCDMVDELMQRNSGGQNGIAAVRMKCLVLRGRVALRQGAAAEAFALAQEATRLAASSPKPADRASLTLAALALGSDALQALGQQDQAIALARQAIAAVPSSVELKPSEVAEFAKLQSRVGNLAAAQKLMADIAGTGYRRTEIASV